MTTSTGREEISRYLENRQGEIDGMMLYRTLAEIEPKAELSEVYRRMAEAEERHALLWEEKLQAAGHPVPERKQSWRSRTLSFLARRFGARFLLPTVQGAEKRDTGRYDLQSDAVQNRLPQEERSHARLLTAIAETQPTGVEGGMLASLEGRHRAVGGNALRAAVLGGNDGLVSNLSLIMGVAGAALSAKAVLVTGMAGLLAGAGSMAMGEWLSVQSSRELYRKQIAVEEEELDAAPQDEEEEIALIYQAKGLSEEESRLLAAKLMSDRGTALDTLAREELGIDPKELGGSAWEAALTSFVLFAAGAVVPLFPFFFLQGTTAVIASLLLSSATLFILGAAITLLTGLNALYSGFRQLLFGLVAAGITYGIGRLVGVSIAG
jgi:VIT1/CCC1 family predicted Fe2+/Mn2+ transporter